MAEMMRLPVVVIVQQRGGPSTATVIYSQQEVTLTCFGETAKGCAWFIQQAAIKSFTITPLRPFTRPGATAFPFVLGDGYRPKCAKLYSCITEDRAWEPFPPGLSLVTKDLMEMESRSFTCAFSVEEELAEILRKHLADLRKLRPTWKSRIYR